MGVAVFVDRNYAPEGADREEEYLAEFIERSGAGAARANDAPGEEEYLALFMAHSLEEPQSHSELVNDSYLHRGLEIKYSKFVSGYSRLDPGSGVGLVRLSSASVTPEGFNVYSDGATLMCYSLLGEGEVVVNGRGIKLRKYDFIWLDCASRPHFRALPGRSWECAFVSVQGAADSPLFAHACRLLRSEGLIQLTFGAGTRFRSLIWQLLSPRTESGPDPEAVYAHLLLSLFLEVDLAIVSASARQVIVPDIIAAIQSYLERNYSRSISLDALSHTFSISKYHMSREFKRYVGKSPNDYLIDIRLDRAKELLVDSKRTISEIGQLVGIPNTNHFLYLFKNREGLTPSAFRKQRI